MRKGVIHMLKNRIFAAITAACMTALTMPVYAETTAAPQAAAEPAAAVTAAEEPAQTTTATVPLITEPPARKTEFSGVLVHKSGSLSFYEGQEPDYGQLEIELHLEDQWGTYGHAAGSFQIGSGAHANCYTLDTSEVDPNTPGTYYVYVDTVEGAEDDFDNFSEIPQIGLSRGPIHVTMVKHRTSFMVTVMEKRTELQIGNGSGEYTLPLTDRINFFTVYNLWEDNDSAVYSFSDPSVAEIVGKNMDVFGCAQVLQIRFLKTGDTTLTVTAVDGRTASCLFHVISAEDIIEPESITTVAVKTDVSTDVTQGLTTYTTVTDLTDAHGRLVDENGEVIIINGTSAVVSVPRITDEVLPDTVRGDADCSGAVDVADAVLSARYIAMDAEAEITDQGRRNADVNGDGDVTTDDVALILKRIAKQI